MGALAGQAVLLLLCVFYAAYGPQVAGLPDGGLRRLSQSPNKPDWVVVLNRKVELHDITCQAGSSGKPAGVAKEGGLSQRPKPCQVCGGAPAVAAACLKDPRCVAFVMDEQAPGCGDLKASVSGAASSTGHTLYCHTGRGAKCAGQFSFTPRTGMMFTGNYSCGPSSTASSLCFVGGGINAVAAACLKDGACRAFAYNRADQGGYFKNARGVASPTSGSDLYQRL